MTQAPLDGPVPVASADLFIIAVRVARLVRSDVLYANPPVGCVPVGPR